MLTTLFTLGTLIIVSHSQDLQYLGTLQTLAHGVNGEVYTDDGQTIVIKSFVHDGESESFFVLSKTEKVEEPLEYLADELGFKEPLGTYLNEDIRLQLPPGTRVLDYKTLAVYSKKDQIPFGSVVFGQIPKPIVRELTPLGNLEDPNHLLHHFSGELLAIDGQTLLLKRFSFDGLDGQFILFKNEKKINETMDLLLDEEGTANPVGPYRDKDIVLTLKPETKLLQYQGFAVYCAKCNVLFGSLLFPVPKHDRLQHATRGSSHPISVGSLIINLVTTQLANSTYNISGNVFVLDDRTILITRFTFNGMSPDARFVLSQSNDKIAEPVESLGDERGNMGPLRKYDGQDIFIRLNEGKQMSDYHSLGIYCAKIKMDLAHVFFPNASAPKS